MTDDLPDLIDRLKVHAEYVCGEGFQIRSVTSALLTEAASLIQRLEGERDEAISDRNAHAEHVLRVAREANDGMAALEVIDAFWDACGVPSNRKHLSVEEQVSAIIQELNGTYEAYAETTTRAEAAEQALSASQKEAERLKAALDGIAFAIELSCAPAGGPHTVRTKAGVIGGEQGEAVFAALQALGNIARSALQTGGKEHG